jgi:hypothetical protein
MQNIKSKKTMAILIALILTISMTAIALQPTVSAHTPLWTIKSFAYLTVAPNPIGIGQKAAIYMWVDQPIPGASLSNDMRRTGYTLTITAPDGTVSKQTWATIPDSTGIQAYYLTPTQTGNYTLVFDYAGQTYIWTTGTPGVNTAYTGDTFAAATSRKVTLTVQQDQIPEPITGYPLPTSYWTYPIEGQNYNWYTVASNWLSSPYIPGAGSSFGIPGAYQPDGSAPDSAHIMWTKPFQDGGIVGGNSTNIQGEGFYQGGSYNIRFSNPIIIQGILYFQLPYGNSGSGGPYVAWNLMTGEELWRINATATGTSLVPSFGYLYAFDSPNQHGALSGLLIATSGTTWRAYDALTGVLTTMNVTNVPSGSNVAGPAGEYLKCSLTNLGNATNPSYYLSEWNSSRVFGGGTTATPINWYSGNTPANCPITPAGSGTNTYWNGSLWVNSTVRAAQGYASVTLPAYDYNVSVKLPPGTWSIASTGVGPLISLGNIALLTQGSFGSHPNDYNALATASPANITAISLNPDTLGQVLWTKSYPQPSDDNSRALVAWDTNNGVFVFEDTESMTHYGYSLSNGQLLWGPVSVPDGGSSDWNYISQSHCQIAYGNFYWCGYSGFLYCFDDTTGKLLWTYGNGGEGNSTNSGFVTPYGYYPVFISAIADGKVYTESTEHSPNSPLYHGELLRCINATDGTELWTIPNFANQMHGGNLAIASGYLVTDNTYDQQIDAFGKGPSQLTVTAPDIAASSGTPVVIRGTVTDISAGTKQNEQAMDFPNGVPCVSDESEGAWMAYVYMQKPMPTNPIGVSVAISVVDSNGNYREIGTATTTTAGTYSLTWTPDIPGDYQVIATFAGTNSYYPSSSQTTFTVMQAAPTSSPYPVTIVPSTEMYIIGTGIAIIVAIAVVGAVILLAVKKRP